MDRQSVARIAGLMGLLPEDWSLAAEIEADGIDAEFDQRKWDRKRTIKLKQINRQRVANRLIALNHRRRAILRLMKLGLYAPGRRYERFRPLETIKADRERLCSMEAGAAITQTMAEALAGKRYAVRDLRWAANNGYLVKTRLAVPVKAAIEGANVWRRFEWVRTRKAYEGYVPDALRAGIYVKAALTDVEREAILEAEIVAATARMQDKFARVIFTREGNPVAPMAKRRRRLPPADYDRIKANQAARAAKAVPRKRGRPRLVAIQKSCA